MEGFSPWSPSHQQEDGSSELKYRHVHLGDTPNARDPSHLGKAFPFAVTHPFWSDDLTLDPRSRMTGRAPRKTIFWGSFLYFSLKFPTQLMLSCNYS